MANRTGALSELLENRLLLSTAATVEPVSAEHAVAAVHAGVTAGSEDSASSDAAGTEQDSSAPASPSTQVTASAGTQTTPAAKASTDGETEVEDGSSAPTPTAPGGTSEADSSAASASDTTPAPVSQTTGSGEVNAAASTVSVAAPMPVELAQIAAHVDELLAVVDAPTEVSNAMPAGAPAAAASGMESALPQAVHTLFNARNMIDPTASIMPRWNEALINGPQPLMAAAGEAVAMAMANPLSTGGPKLKAAAQALFNLGTPDALAGFADAIAGFAHDSAGVTAVMAVNPSHRMAWIVTAGVLGVDAVLLGHWYAASRRERRRRESAVNTPFSTRSV